MLIVSHALPKAVTYGECSYRYPDIVPWAFGILSVVAVIGVLIGTYHLWLGSRSRKWPQEKGTIVKSELEPSTDDKGAVSYAAKILYAYVVKGKTYTSDMVE